MHSKKTASGLYCEDELPAGSSKVGPLAMQYRIAAMASKLRHRTHPGITYCVSIDFDSDEYGSYTYFIE